MSRKRLAAEGVLYGDDSQTGCKFYVWCEDRDLPGTQQTFTVELTSASGRGTVDRAEHLTGAAVFPWLDARGDY